MRSWTSQSCHGGGAEIIIIPLNLQSIPFRVSFRGVCGHARGAHGVRDASCDVALHYGDGGRARVQIQSWSWKRKS